jgi:hypothetical protein
VYLEEIVKLANPKSSASMQRSPLQAERQNKTTKTDQNLLIKSIQIVSFPKIKLYL